MVMRRRATATLAGMQGRSTTLDALTSLSTAPMPVREEQTRLGATMPSAGAAETGMRPFSPSCFAGRQDGQGKPDNMGSPQANRQPGGRGLGATRTRAAGPQTRPAASRQGVLFPARGTSTIAVAADPRGRAGDASRTAEQPAPS